MIVSSFGRISAKTAHDHERQEGLGWAGLGWAGLGWGWGWAGAGAGLGLGLGWGWAELGWAGRPRQLAGSGILAGDGQDVGGDGAGRTADERVDVEGGENVA